MSITADINRPLPQAHPDFLRVLASWFGLQAQPAEHARVLDIGCGNGSHLIALASHLPEARLIGIDIDQAALDKAQEIAKSAGLNNVRFICQDAAKLKLKFKAEVFDYIICHEVFSHVDDATRAAILQCINHTLTADGVAYVSYDSEPGWHPMEWWREAIRAQFVAEDEVGIEQIIEQVNLIQANLSENNPSHLVFRQAGAALLSGDISTAVRALFNPDHRVFKLVEFMALAHQANLRYVGDAEYQQILVSPFRGKAHEAQLKKFGGNVIARQQSYDYITNCSFHQTLLIKARSKPLNDPARGLTKDSILNMHIQGTFQPPYFGSDNWYSLYNKRVKLADNDVSRALCEQLNLAGNSTVSISDLLGKIAPEKHNEFLSLIIDLISFKALKIRATPLQITGVNTDKPKISSPLRKLIKLGFSSDNPVKITNPWLQVIELDEAMAWLMTKMSGQYNKVTLAEGLAKACIQKKFTDATLKAIAGDDYMSPDWHIIAQRKTDKLIRWLAEQGLLSS